MMTEWQGRRLKKCNCPLSPPLLYSNETENEKPDITPCSFDVELWVLVNPEQHLLSAEREHSSCTVHDGRSTHAISR
jgi:hypothetical protein